MKPSAGHVLLGLAVILMPAAGGVLASEAMPAPRILNVDAHYPEGPVWYRGKLYYVEYDRNTVTTWDGKRNRIFATQKGCGQSAVIPTAQGDFLTTCYDNNTIGRMNAAGAQLPPLVHDKDGNEFIGPNDFAPDAHGGIYFTASGHQDRKPVKDGKVFRIAADGTVSQVATDIHNANGIVVSKDGQILYVVETDENRVLKFAIAADGSLSARDVFVNLDDLTGHVVAIWPDGIKIDSRGDLYVGQSAREAHVPLAGTIFVIDARGQLKRTLVLPSLQVPNFAFSPDERTLYVTAVDQIDKAPFHGKLYAIHNP